MPWEKGIPSLRPVRSRDPGSTTRGMENSRDPSGRTALSSPLTQGIGLRPQMPWAPFSGPVGPVIPYRSTMSSMAELLIRHLEDDVKAKLQRRARRHSRSTEEESAKSSAMRSGMKGGTREPLGSRIAARFAGLGLKEDIPELRREKLP
jgi:plasmid stability protein